MLINNKIRFDFDFYKFAIVELRVTAFKNSLNMTKIKYFVIIHDVYNDTYVEPKVSEIFRNEIGEMKMYLVDSIDEAFLAAKDYLDSKNWF